MTKLYINRKILFGLAAIVIIIFVLGGASFWYSREVIHSSRQGVQSQMLVLCSEQVRSLLMEMEASKARVDSLNLMDKDFNRLIYLLQSRMVELDSLGLSSPLQRKRIDVLLGRIRTQIELIAREWRAENEFKTTRKGLAVEKDFLQQISSQIDDIQSQENIRRKERATRITTQFSRFAFSFFGLLTGGLFIVVVLSYSLNGNLKARANAEQRLQLASASVHDLYENAPCGYFSFDKEGMFSGVNQTLLGWLGYGREKVVHHFHATDVFSAEIRTLYERGYSRLQETGFIRDLEAFVVRQDRSTFPVVIHAAAVMDQKGQCVGCRCTLFDNTERKKAEDKAMFLAKELEAFSYSVSHDLRAPLRSINGYSQILKEDHASQLDEEGRKILDTVIRNATRMGNLIDDLLNFSQANRRGITKSNIEVNELVTQILNELMDNEKGRHVQIRMGELGTAVADYSMFRQVWINLLSNALKYSRKRDTTVVEVQAIDNADEVIFSVKDNGAGFDMRYYEKLFGVFSRLHRQEDFEGTGVGLALVQRIVQRHQGRIWAEAKVDEGATFFFSLAKAKPENPG